MSKGRIQDQVAVVTGAGLGLGRAIALRLAEEDARLALGDIDGPALEKTVADIQARQGRNPPAPPSQNSARPSPTTSTCTRTP